MPDASWASHPDSDWRKALTAARKAGWSFRKFSDHAFGEITCPAGTHSMKIYSTGRGTQNVARDTLKLVTVKCEHRSDLPGTLAGLHSRLDKAERLIVAAETLIERDAVDARIQELLSEADTEVDAVTVDAVGREFDDLMDDARDLDRSLDPDFASRDPGGVLVEAQSETRQAAQTLRTVPKTHEDRDQLEARLASLQARIAACRARLAS
ncbi:MAG: hypothetical protein IT193_19790 [Propionibacteriaceae bacterium]|nr:hypothetical protein [Propionibacteriaceae bacterium]